MRKFLSVLFIQSLLFGSIAAEKLKPISYQFTAPTLKNSPSHADPNRSKLTDGILNSPSHPVWLFKENQGKPIKIDFQFGEAVKLQEVTLHYFRGPKSYGIKRINVFGLNADGSQFPVGNAVLNQPYQLPKNQKSYLSEQETIKIDSPQPVEKLMLEISGTGSYLGISEIEFQGEPASRPAPANALKAFTNPYQSLANSEATGLRLIEKKGYIVLENNRAIYVIDAVNGGCVNFAYDKKAKFNFLKYAEGNDYGGMFQDRFWPGSYAVRDSFRDVSYQCKVIADTAMQKSVRVAANGKSGIFTNVTIEKTYTLDVGSPVLRVDYKVTNDQANVIPLQYGLWIAGGVANDQAFEMVYPGTYQIEKAPVKVQSLFIPGAVRSWCATMRKPGVGLGLICNYELFKTFYFWSNNDRSSTVECRLGVYPIKANESLQTSFALAPFYGIGTPDNLNTVMAGSLGLPRESSEAKPSLTARLLPFQPGQYRVELQTGKLVNDRVRFSTVKTVNIQAAGQPIDIPYLLGLTSGTWVVRARVFAHDQPVFVMTSSTVYQQSSGMYTHPAECAKRPESGVKEQQLNLNFNSRSYETPHVKWAKPFAGKKPKVLAVCYHKGGIRDMVEMAQRFDLELTTNYIGGIWKLSGLCATLSENDCYTELAKQLKNQFNAIVVASRMWQKMPTHVRDAILEQVRNGAGLVLIAPEGLPEELAKSFRLASNPQHFTGPWSAATEHPITSGVPFSALPPTRALPYTAAGSVLAKVGEQPLLSVFTYGKGKVAAAAWATDGRDRKSYHFNYADPVFLPLMLFNMPQNPNHHYWEYQMSLLGKMIYWSADCAGNVSGSRMQTVANQVTVKLKASKAQTVTLELTIRNKFSETEQRLARQVQLKPGDNRIELPFAAPSMSGLHLADLLVKSADGVEWWGSSSLETTSPVQIKELKLADKIWKKSESLTGSVELSAPGEVRISLYDHYGNEFARSTGPAFNLPLQDCRSLGCRLVAEVRRNGQVADRLTRDITLYGKPDARRMQVVFGWPTLSQRGVHCFLLDHYYRKLIELGANALVTFRTDTPAELQAARRNNLPILGSSTPISSGGKFPFATKVKVNSKFDLLRQPCLSVAGFKDKLEKSSNQVTDLEKYGVLFRSGPDEANSVGQWEGCFSKDCQREFRKWLKNEYGSLDALNQSWLTNYTSWNQVYAMTAGEVKNAPSFAPWVDHRAFNDWNRADAIGRIVKGMKLADPEQRYSLSGTQEASAFNAWEWYQLMKNLDALQSYGGEQAILQRCFYPGKLIWQTWIGYDSPFAELNQQILNNLLLGATGFSVYSGDFYVNPDYTLPPRAQELKQAFGRYQNGPAELLINADFVSYPIAFLYSPASIKVNWITGRNDLRTGAVQGYKTLLGDLGLCYDYVASAQLEQSPILARYRILVLPMASALSEKEIAVIRDFVKTGGIVIADQGTAAFDPHGKPYATPQLAELFGIQPGKIQFVKQNGEVEGLDTEVSGLGLKHLKMSVKSFEDGIVPSTAKALAQISADGKKYPAVLVNQYGKGLAVYFACALPNSVADWSEMRYTPNNQASLNAINQLVKPLLARSQIQPAVTIPTLQVANITARRNGPACLVGVSRNYAQAVNLDPKPRLHTVKLNQEYHIYDLLNSEYLGHGRDFQYRFGPDSQCLFVLLPYRPDKPEVKLSKDANRYTAMIRLEAQTAEWANHIFRVELKAPDGAVNPAYSELVFGKSNQGQYSFTLPLNAAPGTWRLQVTDLLTGQSITIPVYSGRLF